MHKFLRAVGFSHVTTKKQLRDLISYAIHKAGEKSYTSGTEEDSMFSEFVLNVGPGFGITVRGEYDEENHFTYEYYFPHFHGEEISSAEDISVERHASCESYAGVCDEPRLGITLIFYIQNVVPYMRARNAGLLPIKGTSLTLTALAMKGRILMPVFKKEYAKQAANIEKMNRLNLLSEAKKGNTEAIETLTMSDMDAYNAVCRKIKTSDVYSLVDTSLIPYGVECDQYTMIGEIIECHEESNTLTKERVVLLKTCCNDLIFDVIVNKADLEGEPAVGRRFKGIIWLQGKINFPEGA